MNELATVQRIEQRHKIVVTVKGRSVLRFLEYAFRGVFEHFVILPFGVVAYHRVALFQIADTVPRDLYAVETQKPNFLKQDFKIREIPLRLSVVFFVGFLDVGV